MIKGKTKSGFEYEISENCLKDWRFLTLIKAMRKHNQIKQVDAFVEYIEYLLGDEGVERLSEHLVDENGNVPIESVIAEFNEIMEAIHKQDDNDTKKS